MVDVLTSDCDLQAKVKAIRSVVDRIVYDKPNRSVEVYYYDM